MTLLVLLLAVLCLAYANGANDNFKGVATLYGSGTTGFRTALMWGTLSTCAGSVAALLLAEHLLTNFSGRGLISDDVVGDLRFVWTVAAAAGGTVLLATRFGLPVSTTHALIGAMLGAGWAAGSAIHLTKLGGVFFLPLLLSPLVAVAGIVLLYPLLRWLRQRLGIVEESCLCVGNEVVEVIPLGNGESCAAERVATLSLSLGTTVTCRRRYQGQFLGLDAATLLGALHFLSAGIVGFARGLNDTPKIAALLLLTPVGGLGGLALVAAAMALGGLLSAEKVAETMSTRITSMSHGQGFAGNLITAIIVIVASVLGLPVSTTHVSCGALFGIGAVTGKGDLGVIGTILAAWCTTLPLGFLLGIALWFGLGLLPSLTG